MTKKVKVWDLPLRLFHWLLLLAVASAWFTIEVLEDMQLHFYSGYAVLTLLVFRLLWGLLGTSYSRFSSFPISPANILSYTKALFGKGEGHFYFGHNPLGSLSVIALLGVLLFQVSSGLFSSDDYFYGPLAGWIESGQIKWLTGLHQQNFEWIKILVALHVLAIIFYRLVKKERLTQAMITGYKSISANDALRSIDSDRLKLAVILVFLSALICYAIVNWLAQPVPITDSYLY